MATRKPRIKVDLRKATNEINIFKSEARKEIANVLEKEIISSIQRGVSPVKGFGRFQQYSESYKKAIRKRRFPNKRRVRPVNLTLTGKLIKSFYIKLKKSSVILGFDNNLANIHNKEGAGKSKVVRRMLPTNTGEKFSRRITTELSKALTKVAKSIFRG